MENSLNQRHLLEKLPRQALQLLVIVIKFQHSMDKDAFESEEKQLISFCF